MIVYLHDEQAIGLFVVSYLYIIQAWADLRCLSFLKGNARA